MTIAAAIRYDKKRQCGWRKEGGVYLMGGAGATPDGSSAIFTLFNPSIPYQVKVHRGPRIVIGDAIMGRRPLAEWWFGSSRDTEEKKDADAWAISVFGMTATKRLKIGECTGIGDINQALAHITGKIVWSGGIIKQYRELTLLKAGDLPRAAEPYDSLRTHLMTYESLHKLDGLLGTQATIWRLADSIPPTSLPEIVPVLTKMLVLLNLPLDAIALRDIYTP